MKKKLLILNTSVSFFYQIIVVICGFILPRVVLNYFGSEINGLVNSITQFLSIIAFMELGIGAAISSSLYGPLTKCQWDIVGEMIYSADKFFGKLARILSVYIFILIFVYPLISKNSFDAIFTGSLIIILSANSFSQYYLGIVDNILLGADQHAFITYGTQAISHIVNTVACVIIIHLGAGIHMVKAVTAIIYIIRPILVRVYIKKHYPFDRKKKPTVNRVKQECNAAAQHISECILDSTDIMVLTTFSTLQDVSIYSVYHLVVYNLKNLFLLCASSGILPVMGSLFNTDRKDELQSLFMKVEWLLHNCVILIFGITSILIVPFVNVYTHGLSDANYIQPLFAVLICLAHASHCIRLPYFMMIRASGNYRQTQNIFIVTTIINIIVSILLVNILGLPGVAIGTLLAMFLQTLLLAIYSYRNLLNIKFVNFIKRLAIDVIELGAIFFLRMFINFLEISYWGWILLAIKVVIFVVLIVLFVNLIFEKDFRKSALKYLLHKKK